MAATTPLLEYTHDGKSTYCYWVLQGLDKVELDAEYVRRAGKDEECPVLLTIEQTTAGPVAPKQSVAYRFTATVNLGTNAFGWDKLYAVPDAQMRLHEIAHANVHSCAGSSVCDVFRDGEQRKVTDQQMLNFTDGQATLDHKVAFDHAGEYNVFAHLVLPTKDYRKDSLHVMAFTKTAVSGQAGAAQAAQEDGMSTGAIVGIVLGSLAVLLVMALGILIYRRRQRSRAKLNAAAHHTFVLPHQKQPAPVADWGDHPEYQWKDSSNDRARGTQRRQMNGQDAMRPYHEVASPSGTGVTITLPTRAYVDHSDAGSTVYGGYAPSTTTATFIHPTDRTIDFQQHQAARESFGSEISMGTSRGFASGEQYEPVQFQGQYVGHGQTHKRNSSGMDSSVPTMDSSRSMGTIDVPSTRGHDAFATESFGVDDESGDFTGAGKHSSPTKKHAMTTSLLLESKDGASTVYPSTHRDMVDTSRTIDLSKLDSESQQHHKATAMHRRDTKGSETDSEQYVF